MTVGATACLRRTGMTCRAPSHKVGQISGPRRRTTAPTCPDMVPVKSLSAPIPDPRDVSTSPYGAAPHQGPRADTSQKRDPLPATRIRNYHKGALPDMKPALQGGIPTHTERLSQVREPLVELSHGAPALAVSTPSSNRSGWTNLGPDSGLTEDQANCVDFWSPALNECRPQRERIRTLDEWALTIESPNAQELVDRLLTSMIGNNVDDN